MEIRLPPVQKALIEQAKKAGYLTLDDFASVYSHTPTMKSAMQRLVQLGYLEQTSTPNKFKYIGDKK